MKTRFDYINEALAVIALREESIGRILSSDTGFELFRNSSAERFNAMYMLRKKLHDKHIHYLECENLIVEIM